MSRASADRSSGGGGIRPAALAKITCPVLAGIYRRTRLFRLLDQTRRRYPIIWLSGPGGAGKTTLIASYLQERRVPVLWYQVDSGDNDPASFFYYLRLAAKSVAPRYKRPMQLLTPEYVRELPTFASNYFRELFGRLKSSSAIVLDNCQELVSEGVWQNVLERALAEVPAGINLILVSREGPPPPLARLRASDRMALFGWEDLRLTATESAAIVKLRRREARLSSEVFESLYQKTQGWVAGLVLLAEQFERIQSWHHPNQPAGEEVFDYFAAEIFRYVEPNVQAFLLKTAFLPKIQLSVAKELTREPNTEAILNYLTRRNLFTVRHTDGSYEYHPLFRGFLASRAVAHYVADDFQAIKRESARLLAQAGDVENAVGLLLQQPPDWEEALALILRQANALVASGRTRTLEDWLNALPEPMRSGNAWVLYWLGICRLPFAPSDARRYFEQAFALFERQDNASPLYLTWCGIIDSYVLERNDFTPMRAWLARYHALAEGRTPPERAIERTSRTSYVLGLIATAFDHPDLPIYAKQVAERVARESDIERGIVGLITLFPYYAWRGNVSELRNALDRLAVRARALENRPLARLSWYTWSCLHESALGAHEDALRLATEGLALASRTGVHVFDSQLLGYGIWGQLCAGEIAVARDLLRQLKPLIAGRRIGEAYYSHYAALVALQERDLTSAIALSRRAADEARDAGLSVGEMTYSLGLAFVLVADGQLEEASQALARARSLAESMGSKIYVAYAALCDACICRARRVHAPMLAALERALKGMREVAVTFPAYLPRQDAAELCVVALENGIEADYVRSAIARARLEPPVGRFPEEWPWPVRIYTLGRFYVVRDEATLAFGTRAGKKPLELLRTLIAFGGRDVGFSQLAQALWPEAEGDLARRNMETTLHRLRRMIGEQSILRQENQLSLNARHCWLDVWAFERLTDDATSEVSATTRARRLLELYRGRFLAEDDCAPVMIMRERLRARFIRTMTGIGGCLEAAQDYETAASCYEGALDAEQLAEELYRRLMVCNIRLGRPAQALSAYRRCRTVLRSLLHVEPGEETESIYREIRRC